MSDAGTTTTTTADPGAGAGESGTGTGGTGGGGEFLSLIPEEIRGEAYFRDIRDVPNLAQKAFHQAKLIGRDPNTLLAIPGPDDADGWNTVYSRLGRPEAADKYQFADPEKVPQGLTVNPEAKTQFASRAHELGLSQKQAAALYEFVNGGRIAGFEKALAEHGEGLKAAEAQLRADWGHAYDDKHRRAEEAVNLLDDQLKLGGGLKQAIEAMPAESRVALGKAMEYARGFFEEGGLPGRGGAIAGALAPDEARQQIAALQQDPQFMAAFMSGGAAGHAEAVQRMLRLHEFLTPAADQAA